MIHKFASVLRTQIRTDMNNYADDCAGGGCATIEEYRKLCGVIQGLAIAERYVIDLLEKLEKQDE